MAYGFFFAPAHVALERNLYWYVHLREEMLDLELDCHMPTSDLHVTAASSELAIYTSLVTGEQTPYIDKQ
jgi:hypothetical protein